MPARTILTDMAVRKLTPPDSGQRELWDSKIGGFGVRVSAGGTKSFVLMYRVHGRQRRMTLGRYPDLLLADARNLAQRALADVASGRDPAGEAATASPQSKDVINLPAGGEGGVFASLVEQFITIHCGRKNRASTAYETGRLLRSEFVPLWRNRPVGDIRKTDVLNALDAIVNRGTPSAANHAFAAIRRFFNWCVERGHLETSPCLGVKAPSKSISRDRVLTEDELRKLWMAAGQMGYPMGTIAQVLALTAQRRGEVAQMRWRDVDMAAKTWAIPADVTKSNRAHIVPLSPTAFSLIESAPRFDDVYVFPARGKPGHPYSGFSKGKRRLDQFSELSGWTLHDLRRTAATGMASLGTAPHVVERILNHSSGSFGGVAGVYNRFSYLPEMRNALEQWERHLLSVCAT